MTDKHTSLPALRALTRNSLILFFSESSSAFLTMLTGLLVARLFDVRNFGKFTAALAFASIAGIVVDSGMGMLAAKDIAKGTPAGLAQLNQIFSWRLWMILLVCLVSPAVISFLLPEDVRRIACWLIPGVLLVGMTDFFCWIFKGAQQAFWCACLQLTSRALLLALSILAMLGPHRMIFLVLAYALTGGSMTALGFFMLRRRMHALHGVRLPRRFFKETLPDIYKLGAILILSVAFTRVDIMLVARLSGEAQAGLFSAAGRIIDAMRLIPMVVYSVYLPVFSALHDQPAQLRSRFESANTILLVLSTTLALIGSAFAQPLFIHILGLQYAGAIACFRPLIWSCVCMFSNILMFSLLYSRNDHQTPFIAIVCALIVEMALDLLWLPRFGITAAAWARLIAEFLNAGILAIGLWRTALIPSRILFLRPLALVGSCVALLWLFKDQPVFLRYFLPWCIFIALAAVTIGRIPQHPEAPLK